MTEGDAGEFRSLLEEKRLGRLGLEVKLDKGFAEGTYCLYVEFDQLAARAGFAAAHRTAHAYCALLKEHLSGSPGCKLGQIKDGSRSEDPRRKRDLEGTFMWFGIDADDGRFHDEAMRDHFRVAFLRAGQAWDQDQAKGQAKRRINRQEKFRGELGSLLDGAAYSHVDAETRERLLREVPALAFPPRGVER